MEPTSSQWEKRPHPDVMAAADVGAVGAGGVARGGYRAAASRPTFVATSDYHQIPRVLEVVERLAPRKVLDVGAGRGVYGPLLREMGVERLVGIEPMWEVELPPAAWSYTDRWLCEFASAFGPFGTHYDLGLSLDVVEHMEKRDAGRMLDRMVESCRRVLVTTPLGFRLQEMDQPYARHLSGWWPWDFAGWRVETLKVYPTRRSSVLRRPKMWQMMALISKR